MSIFTSTAELAARFVNARKIGQGDAAGEPRDPVRPLIFTHIPKTSGTALQTALRKALAPAKVVAGFDTSLLGDFAQLETVQAPIRQSIFDRPALLPRHADLLLVHMAYSTTRSAYPDGQHITVMREPLTRLLSHYLYWRGRSEAEIAAWGGWGERVRLARRPVADFLTDGRIACQTDNIVTRMMLWPHPAIPANGFISPSDDTKLIAAARARLARYAYVAAIERPDFPATLGQWLGRPIEYPSENVTKTMPAAFRGDLAELITRKAVALMNQRTRLDEVLWREAISEGLNAEVLRLSALMPAIARYSMLMTGT